MSKTRILQLIEDTGAVGGAEKLVCDLARFLTPDTFTSLVAVVGRPDSKMPYSQTGSEVVYIEPSPNLSFSLVKQLCAVVKQKDISLVHSHLIRMNTHNALASVWHGRPTVGSIHGILTYETTSSARAYTKLAAYLNDRTVVVSDPLRKEFLRIYNVNPKKVVTIHNGFDHTRIEPAVSDEAKAEFRRRFLPDDNSPVICAVGNLKEVKGYRYLIDAIAILKEHCPRVHLLIAGNTMRLQDLRLIDQVAALGLERHVTLLGEFTNIGLLFSVSNLYVCSSLHEGFSLTTVEAMAAGLPVVVTDSGGPADIVEPGKSGILVPTANADALAKAMLTIVTDSALGDAMGKYGRDVAYQKFSMNNFIKRHEALYKELIG